VRDATALPLLRTVGKLTSAFIDDTLEEALQCTPQREMEICYDEPRWWSRNRKPRRRLMGAAGDVIVHCPP